MDWFTAAEQGDLATLATLAAARARDRAGYGSYAHLYPDPLNSKDELDECTPLYLATLRAQAAAVHILLEVACGDRQGAIDFAMFLLWRSIHI